MQHFLLKITLSDNDSSGAHTCIQGRSQILSEWERLYVVDLCMGIYAWTDKTDCVFNAKSDRPYSHVNF